MAVTGQVKVAVQNAAPVEDDPNAVDVTIRISNVNNVAKALTVYTALQGHSFAHNIFGEIALGYAIWAGAQ